MKASIIIRCYNEQKHIGRLLSGIMEQNFPADFEIIVVDSGSTDMSLFVVSQFPAKVIRIPPKEFSFGRALNLGIRASSGDFIVAASAHVYPVYRDWLEKLLNPFEDPSVALSYGKQRGNESTKYSEHRVFEQWFPDVSEPFQGHPFCNNANAAIRRSLWESIPYNEELTGLEDLDWATKIMARGYRVAYMADAEIIHVHDERPLQTFNRYRREALALKGISPEQHFNFIEFIRLYCSSAGGDMLHALRNGRLWGNMRSILNFRLMQYAGAYCGFHQHGPVTRELKERFYYPCSWSRPLRKHPNHRKEPIDYACAERKHGTYVD